MNSNGLILLEFCSRNHFFVMGSMFQLPDRLKCTWQHARSKHWHQLDHVVANHTAKIGIEVVKVSLTADCFTDHRLVVCKCAFNLKKKKKGPKPPIKPSIIITHENINRLQGYLKENLPENQTTWENFKEILRCHLCFR